MHRLLACAPDFYVQRRRAGHGGPVTAWNSGPSLGQSTVALSSRRTLQAQLHQSGVPPGPTQGAMAHSADALTQCLQQGQPNALADGGGVNVDRVLYDASICLPVGGWGCRCPSPDSSVNAEGHQSEFGNSGLKKFGHARRSIGESGIPTRNPGSVNSLDVGPIRRDHVPDGCAHRARILADAASRAPGTNE